MRLNWQAAVGIIPRVARILLASRCGEALAGAVAALRKLPAMSEARSALSNGLREGEVAVDLPAQFDASLYYHRPHPHAVEAARGLPEKSARDGRDCTIVLDPRWSRGPYAASKPSATSSCSTGWTGRAAIWCCRRRIITPSGAALLRCARRCGPIRSRFRWRGSSASTATR